MQDYTNQPIKHQGGFIKPLGLSSGMNNNSYIAKAIKTSSYQPVIVRKINHVENSRKSYSVIQSRQESRETSLVQERKASILSNYNPMNINKPLTQQNSPRVEVNPNTSISFVKADKADRRQNQSLDFVDRSNISVQEIVKSSMRYSGGNQTFGIDYYQPPNTNMATYRPRTTKFTHYKVPHFIDDYTKNRNFVPGPKYETITNWKNQMKSKGAFSKSPRITFTEGIIKECKLYESPGPGAYDHPKGVGNIKKDEKGTSAKTDKVCAFIEEAKFRGVVTPAPKYDPSFVRIDPDLKYARMYKTKHDRMDKIQKDLTKPSPGDYDILKAYEKTQSVNIKYKLGNSKTNCFIDDIQKAKNFLPGIGAYKVTSKAFDVLSRSPVSMRKYRQ